MKVITAKGNEFECESITFIPSPPRVYLHIVGKGTDEVARVFYEEGQLPINGYPAFTAVQSVSSEGTARVKVSLKIEGT